MRFHWIGKSERGNFMFIIIAKIRNFFHEEKHKNYRDQKGWARSATSHNVSTLNIIVHKAKQHSPPARGLSSAQILLIINYRERERSQAIKVDLNLTFGGL
jgi:hypothetical protein